MSLSSKYSFVPQVADGTAGEGLALEFANELDRISLSVSPAGGEALGGGFPVTEDRLTVDIMHGDSEAKLRTTVWDMLWLTRAHIEHSSDANSASALAKEFRDLADRFDAIASDMRDDANARREK